MPLKYALIIILSYEFRLSESERGIYFFLVANVIIIVFLMENALIY